MTLPTNDQSPLVLPPAAPDIPVEAPEVPGPTLNDAVIGDVAAPAAPEETPAEPITAEQIIGGVAAISAVTVPAEVRADYVQTFTSDPLIALGVQASGLVDALEYYGLTTGGGKLPPWLSMILGIGVLGYGVMTTRSKYARPSETVAGTAETPADSGFAGAGIGTPLSAANIGFVGAGAGAGHD